MFGRSPSRRTRPTVARRAAACEPLEGRQLLSASDLGLRELRSTLPAGAVTGTAVKGTVTVQAANTSTAAISGPETFTVYGTTDGAIDSASLVLGRVSRGNLKLGTSRLANVTVPVKTAITTAATYQLLIQATDGTTVSTPATAGTLTVDTAHVVLDATAVAVTGRATDFLVNHAVTFRVTLLNNGNINTTSPISAVLELSADGTTALSPPLTATPQNRGVVIKPTGRPVTLTYTARLTETGTFFVGGTFSTSAAGTNSITAFSSTPISVISRVA